MRSEAIPVCVERVLRQLDGVCCGRSWERIFSLVPVLDRRSGAPIFSDLNGLSPL